MLQYVNPLFKICYTFLRLLREIRKTSLWAFNFFTHSAILGEELFITIVFIYMYHKPIFYTIANGTNLSWIRQTFQQFFSSNLNKIVPFFQFFRNTDGWQGWQTPPQKNWKLVSPASPNKLAPIKGLTENGDKWHFYILFFLWLTARKYIKDW